MWFDCVIGILSVREKSEIRIGVTIRLQASNRYPTVTHLILIRALRSFDIWNKSGPIFYGIKLRPLRHPRVLLRRMTEINASLSLTSDFNFTRYGLLRGQLLTLSQDVVMHDLQFVQNFQVCPKDLPRSGSQTEPAGGRRRAVRGEIFSVVCQFEFFEGGANHSRRHAKANIAASTPQVPQSYEGSNHEATKPAIMALASNPKTHTAIVLAIAYLCSGRFAILSSCPKDPKARSAPLSQSATS